MASARWCNGFTWGGVPIGQEPGIWEADYNKFINELSAFVKKALNQFRRNIVSMGESISNFRISNTHMCESAQATSQWMDRIQQQVTSIRSDLQEALEKAV